ncbi:hypothetical protein K2173_006033 [Erythroxylum novogranatense]|uniref:Glycosyltransferase n=1 Tax=Erythroxylum novogranatense TaxID=1862640 RepID=A0AAV8TCC8_9ROSI|nr:hypothetical protein K2173_006033 [Erythroxylum novogranatense]
MQYLNTRPHAALLASPGLGHLIPILELAKRLVSSHGFQATVFVVTTDSSLSKSPIFKELLPVPDQLNLVLLPPVDISNLITPSTLILTQLAIMMREALPSFRSQILAMKIPPTALIVDLFGTEAMSIAEDFNMLKYVFITSTAWFLALTMHVPTVDDGVIEDDHVKNRRPLLIPGCMSLPFEDTIEPLLLRNDPIYVEYLRMGLNIPTADGILVNTWQGLESSTLLALKDTKKLGKANQVPVYPVGPLVRAAKPGARSEVLCWLDEQPSESVIYVSFGSGGTLSAKQTIELAWGLESSKQRFVWVIRPPTVDNDAAGALFQTGRGCNDFLSFLPDGFLTRTSNMGLVVPQWAPQTGILSHPSIGGFLSHCGWNSTLESLASGVPMIAWPLYAEQKMNAAMLTDDHIGVAIRSKASPTEDLVTREEIETMVRKIIEDKGDSRRIRAKSLQSSAEKALRKGGSSYNSLSQVANDCEIRLRYLNSRIQGA